MLGKLIKYNFKSTGKIMIPVNIILIVITLFGSILLSTKVLQRDELLPLSMTLLIAYILVISALTIVTTIFLIVHYYRNMFSAQGYLTFTLPASSWTILNSKIIVGFVWVLEMAIMTILSVIAFIGSAAGFGNLSSFLSEMLAAETIIDSTTGAEISVSIFDAFGYNPAQLLILCILVGLTACFYSVMVGYGSVTIGQLYTKHKVVGSVLTYLGIYFIVQILMSISMMLLSFRSSFVLLTTSDTELMGTDFLEMMQSIYQPMFPLFIGFYLGLGIILYVVSGIILKKKVNLD